MPQELKPQPPPWPQRQSPTPQPREACNRCGRKLFSGDPVRTCQGCTDLHYFEGMVVENLMEIRRLLEVLIEIEQRRERRG